MASTNAEKLAKIEATVDTISKSLMNICNRLDILERRVTHNEENIQKGDPFSSHISSIVMGHAKEIIFDTRLSSLKEWNSKFVLFNKTGDPPYLRNESDNLVHLPVDVLMDVVMDNARYDLVLYDDDKLVLTKYIPRSHEDGGPFQTRCEVTQGISNSVVLADLMDSHKYPRGLLHFPMQLPKVEVSYDTIPDLLTELMRDSDLFKQVDSFLRENCARVIFWRGYINGQYHEMWCSYRGHLTRPIVATIDSFINNHVADITEVERTPLCFVCNETHYTSAYLSSRDGNFDHHQTPIWKSLY